MANDPVLIAYGSFETSKGKRLWQRIGEAYPHDVGSGLTVVMHLRPFDGKIVLLERDEADDDKIQERAMSLSNLIQTSK